MKELIDQLYYIAYSPLVTPACLIANVKLPEYQSLTFEKSGQGLVAIMECTVDGDVVEFRYYFDEQDHLNRAISIDRSTDHTKVIFDRAQKVKDLESRIVRNRIIGERAAV